MAHKTLTMYVDGMTCSACEARIEKALLALPGAVRAKARRMGGSAFFEYEEGLSSPEAAEAAIEKAGYEVRRKRGAGTAIALGAGLLLAAAYLLASSAGIFSALPTVDASLGYGMLFVVGLLTSVHCVAMCGGIALSQSLGAPSGGAEAAKGSAGKAARLLPGLLYNSGRVLSYALIGGIVGALGSAFAFSPAGKGAIAGAAGLFMVYLGLKMLGVLPSLPASPLRLPAGLDRAIGRLRSFAAGRGPFAVGLLNGLMPCGPLQTMQLYALGTGSFLAGALSMFVFALGTLPLMLGFGLMAALLPRKTLPALLKAGAVLVIVLGAVTLARAANLAGLSLPGLAAGRGSSSLALIQDGFRPASGGGGAASEKAGEGIVATLGEGSQSVVTGFKDGQYLPFTVQAGVPLKWTIRVRDSDLNGCNNPLTVPAYAISKTLVPGDNLVEFTPKEPGSITYTCWMGMVSSRITVVSSLSGAKATGTGAPIPAQAATLSPAARAGAVGCCSRE